MEATVGLYRCDCHHYCCPINQLAPSLQDNNYITSHSYKENVCRFHHILCQTFVLCTLLVFCISLHPMKVATNNRLVCTRQIQLIIKFMVVQALFPPDYTLFMQLYLCIFFDYNFLHFTDTALNTNINFMCCGELIMGFKTYC